QKSAYFTIETYSLIITAVNSSCQLQEKEEELHDITTVSANTSYGQRCGICQRGCTGRSPGAHHRRHVDRRGSAVLLHGARKGFLSTADRAPAHRHRRNEQGLSDGPPHR